MVYDFLLGLQAKASKREALMRASLNTHKRHLVLLDTQARTCGTASIEQAVTDASTVCPHFKALVSSWKENIVAL